MQDPKEDVWIVLHPNREGDHPTFDERGRLDNDIGGSYCFSVKGDDEDIVRFFRFAMAFMEDERQDARVEDVVPHFSKKVTTSNKKTYYLVREDRRF